MKTSTTTAVPVEHLYQEIAAHYRECVSNDAYLSDTWVDMLNQRGALFSLDTMMRMLELGNRVNSYIDDSNYLIDATVLAAADPAVVNVLLAAGEPEFGHPRRDCRVGDKFYSSNFVHHVFYASLIISSIKERGIANPHILEIGGGLGGVAYLLKAYFGERATYYVVDLPEGLVIQEWYLRNCLPDVSSTYKSGKKPCAFITGGFNFINAYALESQDFKFDVAINIDSMQEMNSAAITAYIKFIERNISEDGLFHVQNNYGQASATIAEPSEYPLDNRWTLRKVEIAPEFECCSGVDQARIVYYRTAAPEDVYTRRLVLRTLWACFTSGKLTNNQRLVSELAILPSNCSPDSAPDKIVATLAKYDVPVSGQDISALKDAIYFPDASNAASLATGPAPSLDVHAARMDALWRAQSCYIKALKACGDGAEYHTWLRSVRDAITNAGGVSDSEFYSAYYASILFVIGDSAVAETLLTECISEDTSPIWAVRFAELLTHFGKAEAARRLISPLKGAHNMDWFAALKAAELLRDVNWLRQLDPTAFSDDARLLSYAKTAARLGEADVALSACTELGRRAPESIPSLIRSVLAVDSGGGVCSRVDSLFNSLELKSSREEFPIVMGFLLNDLGRKEAALASLEPLVEKFWDNYFRLGQMGRFFQQAGLNHLADKCLIRSMELRPGAFLHFDFVGNVYFNAQRFDQAVAAYNEAIRLKPYLRHLLAKRLYCVLPEKERLSGVLGKQDDLGFVFQRDQDFYHDLAPAHRR